MAFYITQSDLQAAVPPDEFLQATDRDRDGVPDDVVVTGALNAGEARAHQYLARRYKLPLDTTDEILMQWLKPKILDFAWEAIYPRPDMAPDDLVTRNGNHVTELEDIRDGKMDLPSSSPPPASSTANSSSLRYSAQCRKTRGGMP